MSFWSPSDPRPPTVVWLEGLSILLLIAEVITSVEGESRDWLWIVVAPLLLWIILSITRGRSKVARWIYTALTGYSLLALLYWLIADLRDAGASNLGDFPFREWAVTFPWLVFWLVELWLLWSPATSRWIAGQSAESSAAVFE